MGNEVVSGGTPTFLTVAEVARVLAVSGRTVRRLVETGRLDAVRIGRAPRARLRVSPAAFQRFVESAASSSRGNSSDENST